MSDRTMTAAACSDSFEATREELNRLVRELDIRIERGSCGSNADSLLDVVLADCEQRLGRATNGAPRAEVVAPGDGVEARKVRIALTLLRQTEALEQDAESFRSLGALCHQINNPLTALVGRAQLLMMGNPDDPKLLKAIKVISESSGRVADDVRELAKVIRTARDRLPKKSD